MARNLKTGWVTLATSGSVVDGSDDGRYIKKEWLEDMAETYNTKVFTAKLWPEHRRYYSGGTVLALKVEPATEPELKGEIQLFGIISPDDWLVSANRSGEYTFPSIELGENYRGTDKFYLKGLGVTDSPASAGIQELHFSSKDGDQSARIFSGHQFNLSDSLEKDNTLYNRIFGRKDSKPPEQDSEAMKDEQFNQLLGALNSQHETMKDLVKNFSTSGAGGGGQQESEEVGSDEEENGTVSAKEFKALESKFDNLNKEFKAAINTEKPGTSTPEGTGGAGDEEVI
ncbi:GPO family capsid scaffolding protein [uncultured Microbulbifer sp.]|uniref:GPO family capsid scaffolding protein n=1 Tax=uncultured Microbulbifer sp. TaxID=348147 RepID=UPI00262BF618|nr:GPO family capsid scaffolding protein [uncultured Microbulbifer sp.]